ncbi:hypothetical protein EON66_03490 [archaeon]|nr:MAG: hypothetical protein EON66_03490 [archaeon]
MLADCVECDAGCGMIIQHRLLQRHVRTDCPFRSIACPQCATQLRAHTVPMHLDTECLFSRVPCPLLCGKCPRTRAWCVPHSATQRTAWTSHPAHSMQAPSCTDSMC